MMKFAAIELCIGHNMWFDKNAPWNMGEHYNKFRDFLYFDRAVWDRVTEELPRLGVSAVIVNLAEGVKYDCAPELAVKGSLEKQEIKEMLARLKELGITAIPKLDFSAAHDAWMGNYSKMPDTCAYREFVKKIIAEVCEIFNYPEYFHLGMGDETVEYQKYYGLMIVRGPKSYWRDAYTMFDACRECGAKPIISGDSYYRDPLVFDKMIPDDVVIAAPYIELWGGRIENETDEFGRDPRSELQKKLETLTNRKNEFILVGKGLPTRQNLVDLFYFASIHPEKNIIGVMSQSELATVDIFDYALLNEAMRLGVGKKCFDVGEF